MTRDSTGGGHRESTTGRRRRSAGFFRQSLYDFSYRPWVEDAGLTVTAPPDDGRADRKQPKAAGRTVGAGRWAEVDADQANAPCQRGGPLLGGRCRRPAHRHAPVGNFVGNSTSIAAITPNISVTCTFYLVALPTITPFQDVPQRPHSPRKAGFFMHLVVPGISWRPRASR
jgi:hypothetical protein